MLKSLPSESGHGREESSEIYPFSDDFVLGWVDLVRGWLFVLDKKLTKGSTSVTQMRCDRRLGDLHPRTRPVHSPTTTRNDCTNTKKNVILSISQTLA